MTSPQWGLARKCREDVGKENEGQPFQIFRERLIPDPDGGDEDGDTEGGDREARRDPGEHLHGIRHPG
jgi:hypothetical protein